MKGQEKMSKIGMMWNITKKWVIDNAPELCLVGAGGTFVATMIYVAKGAVKAQDALVDHRIEKDEIEERRENYSEDDYTMAEYKKEKFNLTIHTGLEITKDFAPAAGFAVATVGFVGAEYGMMKKRLGVAVATAAMATANANKILKAFNLYRKRVIEDKGKDADAYYMTGVKPKEITVKNEDGTKEKKKIFPMLPNGDIASPYAFKFGKYKENGERNHQWQGEHMVDMAYIIGQQDYLTDQLYLRCEFDKDHKVIKRGSVMLNEIRDLLGEDPTSTAAIVGNRFSNGEENCNGYIDFRVIESTEIDPETGSEIPCYWINPNVDGVIFDLLDQYEEHPFAPRIANYDD